jgi:hypothetical protein
VQRGEGGEEREDGGEGERGGGAVVEESEGAQRGEDGEGGPLEVRGHDDEVRELGEVGGVQDGVRAEGCEREEDEGLQTG